MATTPTRLSRQARREHLLEAALALVRERGADLYGRALELSERS